MKRPAAEASTASEDDYVEDSKTRNRPRKKRKKAELPANPQEEKMELSAQSTDKPYKVGPILYVPGELLPSLSPHIGSLLEVHIPASHLTRDNEQVFTMRQIWGDQIFTDDSDIVSILHHSGHFNLPKAGQVSNIYGVAVTLRILAGQESYQSAEKNNLKSRSWGKHDVSLKVEDVRIMEHEDNVTKDLMKRQKLVNGQAKTKENKRNLTKKARKAFADDNDEFRKYHLEIFPESTIVQYNLANEPCFKYNLSLLCDRGVEQSDWTSYRLRSSVLYLETRNIRYELSKEGSTVIEGMKYDTYRWVQVLDPPKITSAFLRSEAVPLQDDQVKVLESNLDWSQIHYGPSSIRVNGKEYPITKLFWFPRSQKDVNNQEEPTIVKQEETEEQKDSRNKESQA